MRLDLELVRRLMLNANDATEPFDMECLVNSTNSRRKVRAHLKMLKDAGLLEVKGRKVRGVTYTGHELAANIGTERVWGMVRERLGSSCVSDVSLRVLYELSMSMALKAVGL